MAGLTGGDGNDLLDATADGSTDLLPGPGNDLVLGSATQGDEVQYGFDATGPIYANLMTGIATGAGVGTDTLVDIDAVLAGPFDDTLIGNDADNGLVGREGDDTLVGNGGDDFFFPGSRATTSTTADAVSDTAEYYDQNAADGLMWGPMNVNLRTGVATGDGTDTLMSIRERYGQQRCRHDDREREGQLLLLPPCRGRHREGGRRRRHGQSRCGSRTVVLGGPVDRATPIQRVKEWPHPRPCLLQPHLRRSPWSACGIRHGTRSTMPCEATSPSTRRSCAFRRLERMGPDQAADMTDRLRGRVGSPTVTPSSATTGRTPSTGISADVLKGMAGDDTLVGIGGADEANGGLGIDRCRAEMVKNCEA